MNLARIVPAFACSAGLGLVVFGFFGCACGHFGTIVSRRTVVSGAEVMDVYGFGALLRPMGHDPGFTLGYRHASYVYPLATQPAAETPTTEWSWFHAPLPAVVPLLQASKTVGIEAQATADIRRCTIGYLSQLLTIGGSPNESELVRVHYAPARPLETVLVYRKD